MHQCQPPYFEVAQAMFWVTSKYGGWLVKSLLFALAGYPAGAAAFPMRKCFTGSRGTLKIESKTLVPI
jgi:hypothetical protein